MDKIPPPSLAELKKELDLLMKYGAPADELPRLIEVADRYAADIVALMILRSFYSYLPEAREDGIVELKRIANRRGVFLICAQTLLDAYLYLADREKAEFLGPLREGIWDEGILEYFGWQGRQNFLKEIADSEHLDIHLPVNEAADLCPVCGTAEGELHIFGCPVEICPWCGGQLIRCECRFSESGREAFTCEAHLDEFQELLEKKGRIPFNPRNQRPTYNPE
jgi:hypothetical protein